MEKFPLAMCDVGLGSWSLWEPWVPAQGLEGQGQDKGTGSAGPACRRGKYIVHST